MSKLSPRMRAALLSFPLLGACAAGSAEVKRSGDSGASDGASDGAVDGVADGGDGVADGGDGGSDGSDGSADGGGQPQAFSIYINELMASNDELAFEGGPPEVDPWTPDWIELYNPSGRDLPLDGYTLSDDPDAVEKGRLDGLVLPAGGHLLLFADGAESTGLGLLPFTLDRDAEGLTLYNPEGQPLDRVEWTDLPTQWVAARVPDGGPLRLLSAPSPGAANPESR